MVVVGGHFVVEPFASAPEWFKRAFFEDRFDAVPITGSWGRSIILLNKSPKYIGDAPPLFDIWRAAEFVMKHGEDVANNGDQIMSTFYPMPVVPEWKSVLENYNPGDFQGFLGIKMQGNGYDELVTRYDFLGFEVVFKRTPLDTSSGEYFISVNMPPAGRTFRVLSAVILDELRSVLRKDEKLLLEKISAGKKPRWLRVEGDEWLEKEVLFFVYYGKVKRVLTYPVEEIEV